MYRLILLAAAAALLAACVQQTPARGPSWRNTGTEIYSNAVLDMAGLKGEWQQVATFAETPETSGCKPGKVRFGVPQGGAVPVQADLCLNGARQTYAGQAALPVPGRMIPAAAGTGSIGQPWWIIWADVNLRTLVIGTPSGEMGFILNRGGDLPADRLTAAREILDWNGYDLDHLQVF